MSVFAGNLAKIHDVALNFETEIEDYTEELCNIRTRMIRKREADEMTYAIPVLNGIIEAAERYRDWILEEQKGEKREEKKDLRGF